MPNIGKISSHMNEIVNVKIHVAITLSRLIIENTLSTIADLYEVAESIPSLIIWECYKAMKIHLKPLIFVNLHDIPYIMSAMMIVTYL